MGADAQCDGGRDYCSDVEAVATGPLSYKVLVWKRRGL